jgi:hypothetical protein
MKYYVVEGHKFRLYKDALTYARKIFKDSGNIVAITQEQS